MAQVLVIDDDDGMRTAIGLMLKAARHEPVEAADTTEALKLLQTCQPAVVITDILMPGRDGIEAIRLIRKRAPGARIIAITGGEPQVYGKEYGATLLDFASKMGADLVLQKPFESKALVAAVDQLLAQAP